MIEAQKAKLRHRWQEQMKEITHSLAWYLTSHMIFREVQSIVQANQKIQSPPLFYKWLKRNYGDSVAVGIRKLIDKGEGTDSLRNLIERIKKHPDAITRDYFVSCYDKWLQKDGVADEEFDKFTNKGDMELSVGKLDSDIQQLDKATRIIKDYTDKWVAHLDKNRKKQPIPTIEDIDNALQDIDEVFRKYHHLLLGSNMTAMPIIQSDWRKPLRHAWIKDDEQKE